MQKGKPFQHPSGPEFLDTADHGVGQGREAKESVLPPSQQQQQHETGQDHRIEQGEDVGTQDVPKAAAGEGRNAVGQPGAYSFRNLRVGQAVRPVLSAQPAQRLRTTFSALVSAAFEKVSYASMIFSSGK